MTNKEIRDQLMTFLLAGHETTANALTWTWLLLSQFRSVRERLTQELNEVLTVYEDDLGRVPTPVSSRLEPPHPRQPS
jgi:cytochrome P450